MSAILRLSGVSKRFGSLLANDNLSMHLNEGEALGVIGPNGSGKTTMFNILTGITKADQGQVFFQGTDITHLRAFERCRRGIARSFQIPHPFAGMSVFENLLVGAAFGDGKPERRVYHQQRLTNLKPGEIERYLGGSMCGLPRKAIPPLRGSYRSTTGDPPSLPPQEEHIL